MTREERKILTLQKKEAARQEKADQREVKRIWNDMIRRLIKKNALIVES